MIYNNSIYKRIIIRDYTPYSLDKYLLYYLDKYKG